MTENEAKEILARYRSGQCTEAERRAIEAWLADEYASGRWDASDTEKSVFGQQLKSRIDRARGSDIPVMPLKSRRWPRYAAAAVVIFALATGTWFFLDTKRQLADNSLAATEILPGGNRATLTLADGRTISLSEAQAGIVIGDEVLYNDGSEVVDAKKEAVLADASRLMSISTPKGGTYAITLPDGTKVWLNAASTLKYPSRFDGTERVVELQGEAFFDVSERWSMTGDSSLRIPKERSQTGEKLSAVAPLREKVPFLVKTGSQTVEVLGTQFNISAYPDDPETKTTLVEGSVRVAPTTDHRPPTTLHPGQQATTRGVSIDVDHVDTGQYTAWKDGKFVFEEEPLESIMKKLARWYDVEVVYENNRTHGTFTGSISRQEHIGQVLEKIRYTQAVDFKIEERRIIVM